MDTQSMVLIAFACVIVAVIVKIVLERPPSSESQGEENLQGSGENLEIGGEEGESHAAQNGRAQDSCPPGKIRPDYYSDCVCPLGRSGANCEFWDVCNGRGSYDERTGTCNCRGIYSIANGQKCLCDIEKDGTENCCGAHGTMNGEVCSCDLGYTGANCQSQYQYDMRCGDVRECSNRPANSTQAVECRMAGTGAAACFFGDDICVRRNGDVLGCTM